MNIFEDQLAAIRTMLSDPNYEVRMDGYDLLFKLWLNQEEPKKFYEYLIPLALEHDNLLKEFENWINHLVVQDSITDAHLRKLHRDLSTEVSRIRQENKVPDEIIITESNTEHGNSLSTYEFDEKKLWKAQSTFAIKGLLLPISLNIIFSIFIHHFDGFFFGSSWKPIYTWEILISILFLNILVTDFLGLKDRKISNWKWFRKFHEFTIWLIRTLFAVIILGIMTDIISDYVRGK